MHGPGILTRTMSVPRVMGKSRDFWQYHSRSDHHSKVACWGILFDLLRESPVLREHVASGAVIFGLNHEMRDFKHNRKKDLDLVLASPRSVPEPGRPGFKALAKSYGIDLTAAEKRELAALPDVRLAQVGAVQMALEAKACMTEHVKALPRLYDELNSSHETIHASAEEAIAVGLVMVNLAAHFKSPGRQGAPGTKPVISPHSQPGVTERVVEKIEEMARRGKLGEQGFDALSIIVIECVNDGTPVRLVERPPAPKAGEIYEYDTMIRRVAQTYASRFSRL